VRLSQLLAFALLGCGTTGLSARGRTVAILDADPGPECSAIGPVAGTADPFFGGLKSEGGLVESASNDARNQAGKMGATHLRLAGGPERWVSGTFGGGKGVTVSGVAYQCERAGGDSTESPAGCSKDTDCKGVRICEAGQCVNPTRSREVPSMQGAAPPLRRRL
jgi:Domain of unknown function (DUF4156)